MELYTFLILACEDSYEINIFLCDSGEEIYHQKEVREIIDSLEESGRMDLLYSEIQSWDIDYTNKQFCINI